MKALKMSVAATEKSEAKMLTDSNFTIVSANGAILSTEKANYNYWFANKSKVLGGGRKIVLKYPLFAVLLFLFAFTISSCKEDGIPSKPEDDFTHYIIGYHARAVTIDTANGTAKSMQYLFLPKDLKDKFEAISGYMDRAAKTRIRICLTLRHLMAL